MIDFPNVPPNEDESNQAVQSIIEQLAMYDVPETRINPNPERPLLRLAHSEMTIRAGAEAVRGRFQ